MPDDASIYVTDANDTVWLLVPVGWRFTDGDGVYALHADPPTATDTELVYAIREARRGERGDGLARARAGVAAARGDDAPPKTPVVVHDDTHGREGEMRFETGEEAAKYLADEYTRNLWDENQRLRAALKAVDAIDTSDPIIGYQTYYDKVTDIVRAALDDGQDDHAE